MKTFLHSRDAASKGAALLLVLAFVVLVTGLALAYFTRTTTDRQLAQTSYNDTSSDLLARTALDIVVNDFKQEIISNPTVTFANIQPTPYPTPIPADIPNLIRYSSRNATASRASTISSSSPSANGRSITTTRWNSHYLVPLLQPNASPANSIPVFDFTPPDWVLVTPQGPSTTPSPSAVIGRYAFAVYDEGGLLDMGVAGYPSWSGNPSAICSPGPTPWLLNVGRKGILAFADLTALPNSNASPAPTFPPNQIDNILGWHNYATTQRTGASFGSFNFSTETDCTKQNNYGSYLLYFGDPPFYIGSLSDKLLASLYPFTAVATQPDPSNTRTDQALATRQQLLKLRSSLGFSQNVLQYMGTFSRERNRPAPDWPGLNGSLSEGRFNLNNLALVIPNPSECTIAHGKKKGWQTGKNKNHLCGNSLDVMQTFGLFWEEADVTTCPGGPLQCPGHWKYIGNVGQLPPKDGNPNPHHGIDCFRGANQQNDFFQILNFALFRSNCAPDATLANVFAVGASLIDQYDSGADCLTNPWGPGCDLDSHVVSGNDLEYTTHTTVIEYGHNGNNNTNFAYGMEPAYSSGDHTNGDCDPGVTTGGCNHAPHRPTPAPIPGTAQVVNRAFTTVGEFGYGFDTSKPTLPTLKFWDSSTTPPFQYAPVLDFFCYNPISSAYPRAGIVNLYTRNAPVIAAMLKSALKNDTLVSPPATGVVSQAEAMAAANAIVAETQRVLAGTASPTPSPPQMDLTRAIAGRLANVGGNAAGWSSDEQKEAIARALAEMGQTRTWNLFIDVIAQTGQYKPNSDLSPGNFIVQGEKRYWLHIALGRDLVHTDGTPCLPADTGCQVDVLGSQLEEVIE